MSEPAPHLVLLQILSSSSTAQCVSVAARLGIADLVKNGPKSGAELARATGTHAPSLYRMLRALASVGVFVEDANGQFGLTPPAACLRSDVPGSQRSLAIMMGEEHFRAWADLLYSVQTGQPAFDRIFGKPIFPYLAEHPESAAIFDDAMTGVHGTETAAMIDAYDFCRVQHRRGRRRRQRHHARCHSQSPPQAARHSLRPGRRDRAGAGQLAEPGFGGSLPHHRSATFSSRSRPGGDAYLMRHIIHDWDDEQCADDPAQLPQSPGRVRQAAAGAKASSRPATGLSSASCWT